MKTAQVDKGPTSSAIDDMLMNRENSIGIPEVSLTDDLLEDLEKPHIEGKVIGTSADLLLEAEEDACTVGAHRGKAE